MERLKLLSNELLAMHTPTGFDLAGGSAGYALAHAALDRALPGRGHDGAVERLLGRAIDQLGESEQVFAGLWNGLAGVGWVVETLRSRAEPDPLEDVDEALLVSAREWPEYGDLDWICGIAGLAAYARLRLPRPGARALLQAIVAVLRERAEPQATGLAWHADPSITRTAERGRYDLGMAHGQAGCLVALSLALEAGVSDAEALLDEGLAWFLPFAGWPMDGSAGGSVAPTRPHAWCYGPVGVGAALASIGERLGRPALVAEGRRVRRASQGVPRSRLDVGLCHGLAGLRVLDPGAWPQDLGSWPLPEDPSLLEGRAGVAVVLAGGADWIRPLLGVG